MVVAASAANFAAAGPFGRFGVLALGIYPLRQYGERDASLRGLARLAAAGNPVVIFPQGHHTDPQRERDGDPAAGFRTGVAHLAQALQAEVLPFGIAGTERIVPLAAPPGFRGPVVAGIPVAIHPGPLAIAFGAPLSMQPGETPQAFTARLQQVCYALTRQAEAALAARG
jgi:1-acyl-sn-glycerol-3-phosphate acyltransferase